MLTNQISSRLPQHSRLSIFLIPQNSSAAAGIVTIHFLTVARRLNGHLNQFIVTSGPQKDPSAERNAVPRKAKVMSKLTDYRVPLGVRNQFSRL